MTILLVSPTATTGGLEMMRRGHQVYQGILYIAASARDAGHRAVVVQADVNNLHRYIRRYKPEVIGFTCVTAVYPLVCEMIRYVKEKHPEIITVVGGHHVTFMYKETLQETGVDFVCRGEGEEVFPALLAALEAKDRYPAITGMVYLKDGQFFNDERIVLLDDINKIPRITLDLVAPESTFTPKIVSSRGCPFKCSYCSITAFYGGKYRQRRVEDVIADIRDYISWGYTQFWFHDDNFTTDAAWLNRFCDLVEQEELKFTFACMSRIDIIIRAPELVARLAASGCNLMSIGIESGVPEVLERINKKISLPQIMKAVSILKKQGISYNFFMLLGSGDEFDTPEILDKNIEFFSKLPGLILISILTPFPGTAIFEKLRRENRIRHYNWEDYDITHCVYNPLGMTYKQMEAYLPKAYMKVYLAKKWKLIPLFISALKSKSIEPGMILGSAKSLFQTYILRKDFHKSILKTK
ncbi:MAG TPA: radical SAM protein [Candidatus Cloacimonadota bacterium]|nr:radical SAM protein [Candidatus Cloacimonadota bacterium]